MFANTNTDMLSASMVGQSAPPIKTVVSTEDIKDIVSRLNSKPFNESFNLFSFDEQSPLEFLELLNKVFVHLDAKWTIDIRNDNQESIVYKIGEYMKILNYTCNYDERWAQQLLSADKKTIYPIFYYLLTRLPDLEKRAYLAKFLVPISIPEEYAMDNEIKTYLDQQKDLQAEFQVIHQNLEAAQKESMNPQELKKEINQLEQEKEQLMSKINIFKSKNTNKPQFQALLEATNLLRREQEEEARLADKLRQQRQQLDWSDQQLLATQQRLLDAKKSLAPDNSPEQMLMAMRQEVKRNRDICRDRLGLEISQKIKKLQQTEQLLSEPPITMNELNSMENNLMMLRRAVNQMEDKLRREAKPEDDKLAIYKQQASLVTKKKERILEDLKKAEDEQSQVEGEIQRKEEQFRKERGGGYKSKDEFKQYANELREKTSQYKRMRDELKGIQAERSILERTLEILVRQSREMESQMREAEKQHGVIGFHGIQKNIEKVSEQKGEIDEQKGKTLEEISKIVVEIQAQCNAKKPHLQQMLKDLKDMRKSYQDVEQVYNQKKGEYDRVMISGELGKLKEDVQGQVAKMDQLQQSTESIDQKIKRLNDEAEFLRGAKQLSNEHKSYNEMLSSKLVLLEAQIKELRTQREQIKENHEPSIRQMNMFSDLKKLLQLKLQVTEHELRSKNQLKGQGRGDMNNLIIG